jgi:hypothetical protein
MPSKEKTPTRFPGFAVSAMLHSMIGAFLLLLQSNLASVDALEDPAEPTIRYSLQLIHLNVPRYLTESEAPRSPVLRPFFKSPASEISTNADKSPRSAATAPQETRTVSTPAFVMPHPVRQTLVRPDVPPDIILKQDVSLPDLLPVFDPQPAAYPAKEFVMPRARPMQRTTLAALAQAPDLAGTAMSASDLTSVKELVELARLPIPQPAIGQPAPAANAGQALVQRIAAPPAEPVRATPAVNEILSISEDPALPQEFVLVPAANQIARGGMAMGNEWPGPGLGGTPAAVWKGLLGLAGIGKDLGGAIASIAALSGERGSRVPLPGTTEVTHPRDGKFGVVVSGSSVAAPYPESSGALSGKVVYTVYLRVGQRKNWILQYCLPKTAVSPSRTEGSRDMLEAPWPYDITRPDHAGDSEYAVVHGMVNKEGHFDELAMIFPQEFEGKELLFQSLNRWIFRPATRDGEQAAVEVLLIIPRETE